jgi:hypothetical protein
MTEGVMILIPAATSGNLLEEQKRASATLKGETVKEMQEHMRLFKVRGMASEKGWSRKFQGYTQKMPATFAAAQRSTPKWAEHPI